LKALFFQPFLHSESAQTIYELVQGRKNAVLAFLKEWQSHSLGMTSIFLDWVQRGVFTHPLAHIPINIMPPFIG
jgi:hypothetical protein